MEDFNAGITGLGIYLPEKRMTEQDFINAGVPKEKIDEWGVYEHRVSEPDEAPSDMSIKAARNLIDNTGIDPEEIDLIIDSALVPDYIFPGDSYKIQYEIGARNAATIDIGPSCGGVIPQLVMSKALIFSNLYKKILITCSCKFTSVADKTDYLSFVLAGDGAAAALISKVNTDKGILSSNMITRGEFYSYSGVRVKTPLKSNQGMVFQEDEKKLLFYLQNTNLFSNSGNSTGDLDKFILESVPFSAKIALYKIGLSYKDVDFWVTHQNTNALHEHWIDVLGIKGRNNYYHSNYKYGNIYNANLLVNLKEAVDKNCIKDDDVVVLGGLSSGFSTGTVVVKWAK